MISQAVCLQPKRTRVYDCEAISKRSMSELVPHKTSSPRVVHGLGRAWSSPTELHQSKNEQKELQADDEAYP